jgi:hypothetical protein
MEPGQSPEGTPLDPVQGVVGAGAVFLGHASLVLIAMIAGVLDNEELGGMATGIILLVGVSQVAYVGPLLWWSWRSGRRAFFWGALAAAAVTLLLNGGCWGIVSTSFSGV